MDNPPDEAKSSRKAKAQCEQRLAEQLQYQQRQQQQHLLQLQQQVQRFQHQQTMASVLSEESCSQTRKRKLYVIAEQEERSTAETAIDVAYDADVDDDVPGADVEQGVGGSLGTARVQSEREHIYELFQPWALKTYADQAKTKTITLRKKARILKALEGKEHSRPDSSKFRFWVKTKGFTTKRPEGFEEAAGGQRRMTKLPPNAVLSDNPSEVDLFVASTSKDFGKRVYRKVAVVEEFFDIIFNVHMELGGRSGMHAGQKRTYRIITETYGFLPREAVTRFLSTCPECKKNLRPSSPAASSQHDEPTNESSSEVEVLNYSSHTESSLEAGPTTKSATKPPPPPPATSTAVVSTIKRRNSNPESSSKLTPLKQLSIEVELPFASAADQFLAASKIVTTAKETVATATEASVPPSPASVPKIRVNPLLQRPLTPPIVREPVSQAAYAYHPLCFDMKSRDSLFRYYEFMHRFYAGGFLPTAHPSALSAQLPVLTPPLYGSGILQSLRFPSASPAGTQTATAITATTTTASATPMTVTPTVSTTVATITVPSDDDEEEDENGASSAPLTKKFKTSPESSQSLKAHSLTIVGTPTSSKLQTQSSAINLSKHFLSHRSNGTPPPPTVTSTPTAAIKSEASTSGRAELRLPHLRASGSASLPPLDLERLKPITSTYLQLTRSMGLSDEDALRFDNLVSKDFEYSL